MTKYGLKRACIAIAVLFAVNIAVISLAQNADAASYKRGSTGSVVSEIQQKLKDWGYYSADVDGIYGSRTEAAVLLFQQKNGLAVDGKAGAETLAALGISSAGLIAAICEAPIWLQVLLFFIVSIAALIATRPLVRKMMGKNIVPTNADAVLGKEARVTEAIDNTVPSGAVYVDGKTWSARSESGETLPEGTLVRTVRMEGVKLFVERL